MKFDTYPGISIPTCVKDLLFGMENLTEQENESLFVQVQDFIVKSGRFL